MSDRTRAEMRARAYPGAAHAPAVLAGLLAVLLGALWAALLAPGAVPVAAEGLRSVTAGARLLGPEQGAAAPQFGDLFDGVSCAGTLGCMAVGASQDPAGVSVPLADQRVGSTWGPALRGGIAGDHDFGFHAVSCPAVDYCEGVSYHGPTMTASHQLPLAAGWDGRSWRLQEVPVPAGSTGASLLAVSCLSAGFCEAVGYSAAANGDTTLAEIWDGTGWRAQLTPAFAPGLHVYLSGVSCASGRDCEAVGERAGATKGSLLPLLEEWNGRSWEVQPSPLVPKADGYASLSAVSCASPRACEAVGFDEATDGFAEVWDGRSWKLQPVPQPSGKGSLGYLYSVSCASPGTCVAVGFAYTAAPVTHAFVVAWDGAHWESQTVPAIAGDSDVALFGVSCPSASDCEAVGSYSDGTHGQHTLAEAWTGSAWHPQLTPGGIGKP